MAKIQRVYLQASDTELALGAFITVTPEIMHYLGNVLRLKTGDPVIVFDGKGGGDFCAVIHLVEKKRMILQIQAQGKTHAPLEKVTLAFALLKKNPTEYVIQKATELGAGVLQPIVTEYTCARELAPDRARAIAIEAAEQCGLTAIPELKAPISFVEYQKAAQGLILFCDEGGGGAPALSHCLSAKQSGKNINGVLIGPEGGFSAAERSALQENPVFLPSDLGKRILRAETAAVVALAIRASVF